jgi:hypothetical protein
VDTRLGGRVADNTDGLSRTLSSAGVRLGPLSADRQATQVTDTPITLDALKALQVHADLAAKVAFDDIFPVLDGMDDLGELLLAQIFRANGRVNIGLGQDVFRVAGADAVNVTQRDVDAFIRGNFYSDDACHTLKLD